MALFDILPEIMNQCGQNCNQAFSNVMDQDWNHWKLQMQSWMEDAKEAETQTGATGGAQAGATGEAPPTCGASAEQTSGCGRNDTGHNEPHIPFLDALYNQFVNSRQQNRSSQRTARKEAANNLVKNDHQKYVIKLDVQHFESNEISVRMVDNQLVVDGEHPERSDRLGRISRKFQRKYDLPEDVEPNTIVSTLTASGVLIIEGLKKRIPNESGNEIVIPVIREGTNETKETDSEYRNDQQMD